MASTRVLLTSMPRMLHDLVVHLLASAPEVEVVEGGGDGSLEAEVSRTGAEAVLVAGGGELTGAGLLALYTHPRLRLVVIRPDGRAAAVWRLCPTRMDVSDIGPAELLDAVRAVGRFGEA